jgi:hypothetical protein
MNIGEYAQMINGEQWLKNELQCKLTVIPAVITTEKGIIVYL